MTKTSAPPPTVPPRTSLRPPKQRRRRSLPDTSTTPVPRRSANHVSVKPASPEIISSLISSLSAISSSTEDHFADYSYSTPSSPCPSQTDSLLPLGANGNVQRWLSASPSETGFGMEHSSDGRKQNRYLYPNGGVSTQASLRVSTSYQDLSSRSKGIQKDEDAADETYSIGNPSIEPKPWQSSTSLASIENGTLNKYKSYKGLSIKGSIDRLREKFEKERVPKDPEFKDTLDSPVPQPSPLATSNSESITTPSQSSKSPRIPNRASSIHSVTSLSRRSDDLSGSPGVVGKGHIVPSRDSSLRHSIGGASSHRKRKPRRSNNTSPKGSAEHSTAEGKATSDSQKERSEEFSIEDEVTRRIRELKDQKRMREISLTVATPDPISLSSHPNRTPSPWRPYHDMDTSNSARPADVGGQLLAESIEECVNDNVSTVDEKTAPSPSIVQRVDRSSKRYSLGSKFAAIKPSAGTRPSEPHRTQSTPIHRTNSKLLRRLSRPISPTAVESHRRTFSNPSQPQSPQKERPKSTDSVDDAVDTYLSASRLSQKTAHPQTGRIISFSEVGDPDGSAVICCVGMGLTRYIMAFYDDLAKTLKLRLVTPDRPGVGGSEPCADGSDTPLGWADDVLAVCQHLGLKKFSLLAHSAGAIYALATALRMPQHIRGRIHLLAPWIPPSQMSGIGTQQESLPTSALPLTQRFLQSLPTSFLKAANSSYLKTTSASITTSLPKSPRRSRRRSPHPDGLGTTSTMRHDSPSNQRSRDHSARQDSLQKDPVPDEDSDLSPALSKPAPVRINEKERQATYDTRLTESIWEAATTGANPAVDLLVCLERRQPIGFRYVDITRSVVIHHGSKDTRVPVENVKWLGKTMRRCEVRVLDGEGHGLMASAVVMGNVLVETAKEWEDWNRVVQGRGTTRRGVNP
ncbi:MAG: hypothetical protein Q9190_004152 [Brigantiaea leucoxantha]